MRIPTGVQLTALLPATLFLCSCQPLPVDLESLSSPQVVARAAPLTIREENLRSGTTEWQLTNPATTGEIEGFASATSVNRGEQIRFYVNTADPTYSIEVFRMGWYGGAGARRVMGPVVLPGTEQPAPHLDRDTGLVECAWRDPYLLTIADSDPSEWVSGFYLTKLTGQRSGKQAYIIFVVRDDYRPSDLLFQSSVTTFEAYNSWGGRSLYTRRRAYKVSFNRPYKSGHGAAEFLSGHWEYNMVRFLEREGYDVSYSTDEDTHARGNLLLLHKGFLSVGHDEYWSWQMRDHVEAARERGVSLGFFGANASYWQIRFESSPITGDPYRTVVCYKNAGLDPLSGGPLSRRTTVRFRNSMVGRPEDAMVGVMYEYDPVAGDIEVEDESSWVFAGTGLHRGDRLPGLLGYEVDRMYGNAPAGTQRIAHSPYVNRRGMARYSDMTTYTPDFGGIVFATGSMSWNWGLDDYRNDRYARVLVNPAAQQATRNVLSKFGARPHP